MSTPACRARATRAAGSMGRRRGRPRQSMRSQGERSGVHLELKGRVPSRRGSAAPCRWRGRSSTCGRPSQAAGMKRRSGLPHGQASAIAARKASLGYVVPCLCLMRAKKIRSPKRLKNSSRTLDCDSRKWDSQCRQTSREGLPEHRFGGLFSFAVLLLISD